MNGDPYCSNCGYALRGLTESSKCPECGKPLVEVLQRGKLQLAGYRFTSNIVLFGLPLLSIAFGPSPDDLVGHARGIIAIGGRATGWLAIGGFARGFIAIGGLAIGLVSVGGTSIGLMLGSGGCGIGGMALGGAAIGGVAFGGSVIAVVGSGGAVIAYYGSGGGVIAKHRLTTRVRDTEAVRVFSALQFLYPARPSVVGWIVQGAGITLVVLIGAALPLVIVLLLALRTRRRRQYMS